MHIHQQHPLWRWTTCLPQLNWYDPALAHTWVQDCNAELKRTLLLLYIQTYFARTRGADSNFKSLNFFRTSWNFLLLTSDDKISCISFLNIIFPFCFISLAFLTSERYTYTCIYIYIYIYIYTHTHTHTHRSLFLLVHTTILQKIKPHYNKNIRAKRCSWVCIHLCAAPQ